MPTKTTEGPVMTVEECLLILDERKAETEQVRYDPAAAAVLLRRLKAEHSQMRDLLMSSETALRYHGVEEPLQAAIHALLARVEKTV